MTAIIITGVLVLIGAILIYAATKPAVYPIERSVLINASADKIFVNINNFRAWKAWTPYNKDPNMTTSISGPESGPAALYSWDSKGKAGKGSMEITKSISPKEVHIDLRMLKPFQVVNKVEFLLQPQNKQTKVTWRMQHHEPYPAKVIGMFMSMDKMVGSDFEAGLTRLKNVVEQGATSMEHSKEQQAVKEIPVQEN